MEQVGPLAQFLRARRAMVEPEAVALPRGATLRRVPGLRREEVSLLAGISSDYYLKLEQGRELHPARAVLDGLGRALVLDAEGIHHLHRLARPAPPPRPGVEEVSPSLIGLIRSMHSIPAHVVDRHLDILYVNPLAAALSPGFRVGSNLVALVFHPAVPRDAYWRTTARRAVAYLRASIDPHDNGPRINRLLAELRAMEPDFTVLWEQHDARVPTGHPSSFDHSDLGVIELRYQTFDLPGTGGQSLGMYIPAPGGPSAEKLQLLSVRIDAVEGDRAAPRNTGGTTGR